MRWLWPDAPASGRFSIANREKWRAFGLGARASRPLAKPALPRWPAAGQRHALVVAGRASVRPLFDFEWREVAGLRPGSAGVPPATDAPASVRFSIANREKWGAFGPQRARCR